MNAAEARYSIQRLYRNHLALQGGEIALQSIGLGAIVFAVLSLWVSSNWAIVIALGFALVLAIALVLIRKLQKSNVKQFLSLLNFQYPALEQSADLLFTEASSLTNLQRIQQLRVADVFSNTLPEIKLPHKLYRVSILFFVCIVSSLLLQNSLKTDAVSLHETASVTKIIDRSDSTVVIKELKVIVTPPAYTKLSPFVSQQNLIIPSGSTVQLTAILSSRTDAVSLIYSAQDTLAFTAQSSNTFTRTIAPKNRGFYQLLWVANGKQYTSDFYKIEIIDDNVPKINITNLEQFTEVTHETTKIDLAVTLSDEYGLSDAGIIATVSKGSGESVKFREVKMRFDSPKTFKTKQIDASLIFDLKKLGLEPGDELYFYVEAYDNQTPHANKGRTETYFIALKDTATYYASADDGLGVDLMPDYFRSQRQIIIDTEKLIRNKKKISKEQFNFTSNELGYDQKVLRLRYSEFMGEEFVSGIGPQAEPDAEHEEEDVTKAFGHVHDSENEHNLVEEKHEEEHEHHHEESNDPEKKEDPLAEFVHAHDDTEEVTFFVQSVKAKLRAALTLMWDAELHLRMFDPQKSLPYQYKILNLLKEISNDSRIYVHRTGFDPPPIKEDKRYTAELHEVKNSTTSSDTKPVENFKYVRESLSILDRYSQNKITHVSSADNAIFQLAGSELAKVAIEDPARYLDALQALKLLTSAEQLNVALISKTHHELMVALPAKVPGPPQAKGTLHSLDKAFIDQLNRKHE